MPRMARLPLMVGSCAHPSHHDRKPEPKVSGWRNAFQSLFCKGRHALQDVGANDDSNDENHAGACPPGPQRAYSIDPRKSNDCPSFSAHTLRVSAVASAERQRRQHQELPYSSTLDSLACRTMRRIPIAGRSRGCACHTCLRQVVARIFLRSDQSTAPKTRRSTRRKQSSDSIL